MTVRARSGEDGFTIIELLVSLAITAAASAVLVAALWSSHAVANRTGAAVSRGESVSIAQAVLRERIGHLVSDATPAVAAVNGGQRSSPTVDVDGNARALSFVASAPAAQSPAPPLRYVIALDRNGRLLLSSIDARTTAAHVGSWRAVALLDGVAGIDLAYYGVRGDDVVARWWSNWVGGDPPALVRLRVGFVPHDTRSWPDLVVHPQVSVAATCHISPANGECS